MRMPASSRSAPVLLAALLVLLTQAAPAFARIDFEPKKPADGKPAMVVSESEPGEGGNEIEAAPEISGPGRVSTVGNVWLKTTNIGYMGNRFQAQSTDPSAQWPGPSGVEYLFAWALMVAGKNPEATSPNELRRVSRGAEWRPPSLAPEDRIYQSYDGQVGGTRDFNDDGDSYPDGRPKIDEDPLNGKDDDFDGQIDEDYGAISQQMYACEMRDDTEQAVNGNFAEKHVPLSLLARQYTYAFAIPGTNDFTGVDYEITNVSGHELDSVFVGFEVDLDTGAKIVDRFYADDLPEPRIPQGDYPNADFDEDDARFDAVRCNTDTIHVRGFTNTDDDGDDGRTEGACSFLLLGHTIDPTGVKGPMRIGFHSFAAYLPGRPYPLGGPTIDAERFEAMSRSGSVDPSTGFLLGTRPDEIDKGDYFEFTSIGPYRHMLNGETIKVSVALAVERCNYTLPALDPSDETRPNTTRYSRIIENAIEAQRTYDGKYLDPPAGVETSDAIGRETGLRALPGQTYEFADCRDVQAEQTRTVTDQEMTWFDLDCDYCTGVRGKTLRHWLAAAPPPSPALRLTAADKRIVLEWDNLSEVTPDPTSGLFDFYSYRIWKASNFTRPVGSTGPSDDLWALLAEYRRFDDLQPLRDSCDTDQDGRWDALCEVYPVLLNAQNGDRLYPSQIQPCAFGTTSVNGHCPPSSGAAGDTAYAYADRRYLDAEGNQRTALHRQEAIYPAGRYHFEDTNVLNGFVYFYSVTGRDSTGIASVTQPNGVALQEGRHAATESAGITPQDATAAASGEVYVVPNPYRAHSQWDLTPNASDPTGTHIDFFNMPSGIWTIRIFTLSGDLVQTIRNDDLQTNGRPQQETPDDGQASWNLISRNGQDVASGIYLFSVESAAGTSQGKFVLIR